MLHPPITASKLLLVTRRLERKIALSSICLMALMSLGALKDAGTQEVKASKPPGSISGRVTIEGKPASGLDLELRRDALDFADEPFASTRADEEGRYRFADVPANHYWVTVKSRAYVSDEWNRLGAGRSVSIADGAIVTNADVDLTIGGAVSGRITDSEGNPVVGEMVHLEDFEYSPSSRGFWQYSDEFKTNSNGAYRVYGVPTGHYFIRVGVDVPRLTGATRDKYDLVVACGRVAPGRYFEQMYYPGTSEEARAHSVEVSADAEVTGIDFTIGKPLQSFLAHGRVIDAETGKPILGKRKLQVSHRFRDGGYMGTLGDDEVNEDGSFEIAGLLSERFRASVVFEGEADLVGDKVEFEIKDADVSGLEIKAHHGFTIDGVIVIDGDAPAAAVAKRGGLKVTASSPIQGEYAYMNREATVSADGKFKLIGMPRGPIEISASHCDTCEFFTLERVEYPTSDPKGEMQLAQHGWSDSYHLINVDRSMKGMRLVLHYKGATILCHVDVIGSMPSGVRLIVDVAFNSPDGKRRWGGWREFDANGDMLEKGLDMGTYELTIGDGNHRFTEARKVTVTRNQPMKVSFTLDASKIQ